MATFKKVLCKRFSTCVTARLNAGQPTPATHPELLSAGEIMPGISAAEFQQRRKKLMSILPVDSLVIIASAPVKMMSDVVPYPYRQDPDYSYFTGCQQPGGIATIRGDSEFTMFMPEADSERATWEGKVADTDDAVNVFKADQTYTLGELQKYLPDMVHRSKNVYCNDNLLNFKIRRTPKLNEALQKHKLQSLHCHSGRLRLIKSPAEIAIMRRAAEITCQAFLQAMRVSRNWPDEHVLAATFEYESKIRGAQRMAFPPVVGGGSNATVIHYSRNDETIREGDLVLMDAGCELHGYASDVTRTWPPCGSFSHAQGEVYQLILKTMKECLELCHPGSNLQNINKHSSEILSKGIADLGIVQDLLKLNPTAIGHYLGMDVHDASGVGRNETLRAGMVITIEPGLYFSKEDSQLNDKYGGIGIRIEDEVLITEDGYEVLSSLLPTSICEVEKCLKTSICDVEK